ncbi:MAG: UpxY family transcription antiterminator [Ferruginibacter sp.]
MTEEQRSFVMSQEYTYWYVVYTKPRWEKKVSQSLENKGIEHYCPLNKVVKQWSDRKKVVLEPLFKGYVFVKIHDAMKWDIKKVDGILNYVYWLGKPAKVKEAEINTIRKFLQEFKDVEVVEQQLSVNSKVLIRQGVMMNFHGIVIEVVGNKAKVNIDSMGIRLSAVFDKKNLETSGI